MSHGQRGGGNGAVLVRRLLDRLFYRLMHILCLLVSTGFVAPRSNLRHRPSVFAKRSDGGIDTLALGQ